MHPGVRTNPRSQQGTPERLCRHAVRSTRLARTLSDREREVFRGLARGKSNAAIAADLYLGEATVKTHVSNVLSKLSLRDRVQAVIFAYEHGIIAPGDDA